MYTVTPERVITPLLTIYTPIETKTGVDVTPQIKNSQQANNEELKT
jgi:hypothetical protein